MYNIDERKHFRIRGARINFHTGPIVIGTVKDLLLMVRRKKIDKNTYSYNQHQREITYRNSWSESEYLRKDDTLFRRSAYSLEEIVRNDLLRTFASHPLVIEKNDILDTVFNEAHTQMMENLRPSALIRVAPRKWMILALDNFELILNANETAARLVCYKSYKPVVITMRRK